MTHPYMVYSGEDTFKPSYRGGGKILSTQFIGGDPLNPGSRVEMTLISNVLLNQTLEDLTNKITTTKFHSKTRYTLAHKAQVFLTKNVIQNASPKSQYRRYF